MKLIIYLLFFITSTFGVAQTAESVLKSLQNKFDSISDISADIVQKSGGRLTGNGKLLFKKDNNLRVEIGKQTIIANGETTWNYSKKDNKVIINNYDEAGSGLFSINYLVYKYPTECNLNLLSEGSQQILVLTPKSKRNSLGEVKLYISKENLIDRVIVSNPATGTMDVSFSNYKLNQKLPDSQFSFTAPEGTTVVDLR